MPAGKTKKGRKIGRNAVKCAAYRARVGKPSADGSKHPRRSKRR